MTSFLIHRGAFILLLLSYAFISRAQQQGEITIMGDVKDGGLEYPSGWRNGIDMQERQQCIGGLLQYDHLQAKERQPAVRNVFSEGQGRRERTVDPRPAEGV